MDKWGTTVETKRYEEMSDDERLIAVNYRLLNSLKWWAKRTDAKYYMNIPHEGE